MPTEREHSTAAVIGGGIAGMTAAYRLQQAGFRTTVFEERDRVGGRIETIKKGDFLMDMGTAVYLGTYSQAIDLIHESGLSHELVEVPATLGLLRDGTRHHVDLGHTVRDGLRSRALSPGAKLQLLKLANKIVRVRKGLGYDEYDALQDVDKVTVTEYCRAELGDEVCEYIGRPIVRGTWAVDPDDTSLGLLLWSIRNMLVKTVFNLTSGVVGLPAHLAKAVDTRVGHPVSNVVDNGSGVEVTFTSGNGAEQTETFDVCIIATTAQAAIKMFPQMDENTRGLYEDTQYRQLGTVCFGLSERPADTATFYLVPPIEDPDTVAVIADHLKAPGRAPEGKGLVTILLSQEYLERSVDKSDEDVLQDGFDRMRKYYGDLEPLTEEWAVKRWDMAVPVMQPGRFARIMHYRRRIDRGARVQFASDLDRISGLNGGLVSGQEAARRVVAQSAPRLSA